MNSSAKDSWKSKIKQLPSKRVPLGFDALYDAPEADIIRRGLIPRAMEDKWFIYFEDSWLYFHRSWSGHCIYAIRFDESASGLRVVDSWVNRESEQYKETDVSYDRKLIEFLIDAFLLHKPAKFPKPTDQPEALPGVFQHSVVGRAYPEIKHQPESKIGSLLRKIIRVFKNKNH